MKKSCKNCGYLTKAETCAKCTAKGKLAKKSKSKKGIDSPIDVNKAEKMAKGKVSELRDRMAEDQGVKAPKDGVVPNVKQDFITGKKQPKATQSYVKPKSLNEMKKAEELKNMPKPKLTKSIEPGMSYSQLKKAQEDLDQKVNQVAEMAEKAMEALSSIKPESK